MNIQNINFPTIFSFIKDIVAIFALGIGAYVAIVGLNTWKHQLKGSTDFELARKILKSVYRLRNAISIVRNHFMTSGEMSAALKEAGIEIELDDPKFHAESNRAVYAKRWKSINEALIDLEISTVEAEAIWGKEIRDLIKEIRKSVASLSCAIDLILRHQYNPDRGILKPASQISFEKIIYKTSDDTSKDRYAAELEDRIKAVEDFVKPRIPT